MILMVIELAQSKNSETQLAFDFVSAGVGCFALTLIESVGIVSSLIDNEFFDEEELSNRKKYKKPAAIKAALLSLCVCKVLSKSKGQYFFTALGKQLAKHIGLVTMIYDGYGKLMATGVSIALGKVSRPEKYINFASIALSSIQFGEEKVDPIVSEVVKKIKMKGTICDLGCGTAYRLLKLCQETSLPGLGLDADEAVVKIAKSKTEKYPCINIEKADVANLEGIWEDVQILMQSFMTHDIFPDVKLVESLRSYRKNFPNLQYFLIIDIVAPEDNFDSHMPAYDYVHGLIGIETRRYDRFTSLFEKAGYEIFNEVPIDLPNTYLWVLRPKT
jgi:hypothetical protein